MQFRVQVMKRAKKVQVKQAKIKASFDPTADKVHSCSWFDRFLCVLRMHSSKLLRILFYNIIILSIYNALVLYFEEII